MLIADRTVLQIFYAVVHQKRSIRCLY